MTLSQYNSVNFKKVSAISWFVQGTPIQVNTAVVFVVLLLTPLYTCVLPICVNRSEIVALPDSNALQKSYLYQAIGIQYEYTETSSWNVFSCHHRVITSWERSASSYACFHISNYLLYTKLGGTLTVFCHVFAKREFFKEVVVQLSVYRLKINVFILSNYISCT